MNSNHNSSNNWTCNNGAKNGSWFNTTRNDVYKNSGVIKNDQKLSSTSSWSSKNSSTQNELKNHTSGFFSKPKK
jgi:hypothetical protein